MMIRITSKQDDSNSVNSGIRINVGCGNTPIKGWRNFDNSLSIQISKIPWMPFLLRSAGILDKSQYGYIIFIRKNRIEYADAAKRLPVPDNSVDVVYSSHMFEHLDQVEANSFINEVKRVLRPKGIIRLVVPDLKWQIQDYLETKNANGFIAKTNMAVPRPRSLFERLKFLIIGARHHYWMYDAQSLCKLLECNGFVKVKNLQPGQTTIIDPGPLNLTERSEGSIYIEALAP